MSFHSPVQGLRILLLEDSQIDAELIQAHLDNGDINSELMRVETRADFIRALENQEFDLILADYALPSFDGVSALAIANKRCPDVPFIFVSATLGEEIAIDTLKKGATDYILKQRLGRLAPSIQRAIQERQERTKREQAERKLYHREQEFKALVENSPDIVTRFDRQMRHVYINPAIEKVTGVPPQEFIGKTNAELGFPEEQVRLWEETLSEIFATGQAKAIEFNFLSANGIRYYQSRLVPEFALDGSVEFVLSVTRDITNLKEIEKALRDSELRYITLAATVPSLIFTCTPDGRCDYTNQYWYECTGLSLEETKDWGWLSRVHPEDAQQLISEWSNCRKEAVTHEFEYRLQLKDGTYHWFWGKTTPIHNELGVSKWIGVSVDIDERKRAEKEREELLTREQEAREEAENANRLKDEFLATLSHELRTPLNTILGWTQLLVTRKLKAETQTRAIDTIHRSAKALTQLIEDVLDVSRIITGKLRLNTYPIELATVLQAAIETVRPAAQAKEISLNLIIEDYKGNLILGDSNRLQQVFWNLLSNGVKFTPKKGKIEIRLSRVHSTAQVQVSDTGQGISSDFLPYVFERFRQADSSITRSFGGLGLGLSIVRHLVELHGGKVYAQSQGIGQGATFTVELPLRAAVPVKAVTPAGKGESNAEGKKTETASLLLNNFQVLVVDDEADARDLLSAILEEYGATVRTAVSAQDALEALESWHPNVLVSDIGMPDEDGYSLIRKVRAKETRKEIIAVALTAYARAEDRQKALAAGFQLHLPKPVNPSELANIIATLASTGSNTPQ